MTYVIYPDVLFLVNFLLNLVVLKGMSKLLNKSAKLLRCITGAALGATYSCLMLMLPSGYYGIKVFCTYVIVAQGMLLVTFGKCNFREGVRRFALIYTMTYLLSGILNGLYYVFGVRNIFLTLCTFIILKGCVWVCIYYRNKRKQFYDVVIELGENKISIRAFLDTGNSLREPISGKTVSIVEEVYIKKLVENINLSTKYRYIPFHSIGKERGALDGIEADCMHIDGRVIERPILAVYTGKLSVSGEYNMLLNNEDWSS